MLIRSLRGSREYFRLLWRACETDKKRQVRGQLCPLQREAICGGQGRRWGYKTHRERSDGLRAELHGDSSQARLSGALRGWKGPDVAGREADSFLVTRWHPQMDEG